MESVYIKKTHSVAQNFQKYHGLVLLHYFNEDFFILQRYLFFFNANHNAVIKSQNPRKI